MFLINFFIFETIGFFENFLSPPPLRVHIRKVNKSYPLSNILKAMVASAKNDKSMNSLNSWAKTTM